ncbi:hypothetical protein SAMD00024442_11_50 [Candidatus Symbiothrix dinenymphae]|nr:hypothetical protein SAMD00024442_11_50 [Candidatus Symbiothrix dinenymphae]
MELKEIINRLEDLSAADIVNFLCENNISFEVFSEAVKKQGGWDSAEKRKNVQLLLKQKDDDAYNTTVAANTVEAFEKYLSLFPNGNHATEAQEKIQTLNNATRAVERQREEYERMLREIEDNINEYDIDDISGLDEVILSAILSKRGYDTRGVDVRKIKDYREPTLRFNEIPQNESDVPEGYTDVFFWGIPSSGKTCALSAIFNTIKKDFLMEAPDCEKKFGATYRDSLIGIFRNDCGYLPGRSAIDKTQYMPFLFYKNGEKHKRKISFFELSGEVFKYFYEVANNTQIIKASDRDDIGKAFHTLDLLLKSNNQKIHFFFIDYNQETKYAEDRNGLTQSNYLEAAATYFRDAKDKNGKPVDIFKKKTDAVYVVVTKSDEIKGNDRTKSAESFLRENFGTFMGVLKRQCEDHSVDFKVKLFSIGDVIFKKVCIINRDYSHAIINDLLERIKPVNNSWYSKFLNS